MANENKRYVVIGCGGYIGSHLLEALLADDATTVVGLDLESAKIQHLKSRPNFTFIKGDLRDTDVYSSVMAEVGSSDAVINLAAICNPAEYNTQPVKVLESNLFDIYPLIRDTARTGKWMIHFSTSEVYGRTLASYATPGRYDNPEHYILDEATTPLIMGPIHNQRWTYATAKQAVERLVFAYGHELGSPFTIVRPLNFFGPKMDYLPGHDGQGTPRVLASFMSALIDKTPMYLVDGGAAQRTICSIDDAMRAIISILSNPEKTQNQIFNIGNPSNEVTMKELAEMMRVLYADISGDPAYLSHPIETIASQDFYGEGYEDCDRRMPSINNATALLDWEPNVSLEDTLRETMTYYHEHYSHKGDSKQ